MSTFNDKSKIMLQSEGTIKCFTCNPLIIKFNIVTCTDHTASNGHEKFS